MMASYSNTVHLLEAHLLSTNTSYEETHVMCYICEGKLCLLLIIVYVKYQTGLIFENSISQYFWL